MTSEGPGYSKIKRELNSKDKTDVEDQPNIGNNDHTKIYNDVDGTCNVEVNSPHPPLKRKIDTNSSHNHIRDIGFALNKQASRNGRSPSKHTKVRMSVQVNSVHECNDGYFIHLNGMDNTIATPIQHVSGVQTNGTPVEVQGTSGVIFIQFQYLLSMLCNCIDDFVYYLAAKPEMERRSKRKINIVRLRQIIYASDGQLRLDRFDTPYPCASTKAIHCNLVIRRTFSASPAGNSKYGISDSEVISHRVKLYLANLASKGVTTIPMAELPPQPPSGLHEPSITTETTTCDSGRRVSGLYDTPSTLDIRLHSKGTAEDIKDFTRISNLEIHAQNIQLTEKSTSTAKNTLSSTPQKSSHRKRDTETEKYMNSTVHTRHCTGFPRSSNHDVACVIARQRTNNLRFCRSPLTPLSSRPDSPKSVSVTRSIECVRANVTEKERGGSKYDMVYKSEIEWKEKLYKSEVLVDLISSIDNLFFSRAHPSIQKSSLVASIKALKKFTTMTESALDSMIQYVVKESKGWLAEKESLFRKGLIIITARREFRTCVNMIREERARFESNKAEYEQWKSQINSG